MNPELDELVIKNAITSLKMCIDTLELQENNENSHIRILNKTKDRANRAINGLNLLLNKGKTNGN
jgi:hypothetical protein